MALSVDIEKKCGDFTLRVAFETQKEVFAILGASGCGKSLTLKCIAGIEKPDKGRIVLDGRVLFDSDKKIDVPTRKRNVGYLFQDYALFPHMTVLENIMCGAADKALAEDYVRRFYLEGKEHLYPEQLSGGQKQRVALARMLVAKPELIMLDEPFSALDNYLKMNLEREVMKVLDSYDKSVLFVSHDRNEVYRMTDRIAVMEDGRIADIQGKKELFDKPKTLAATLLTGCKNITRLEKLDDGTFVSLDWGIRLKTNMAADTNYAYAGFRAHYFEQVSSMEEYNVLECEVLRVIEDTFSMVVLFCHAGCVAEGDYSVLTLDVPKDKWENMKKDRIFLRIPEDKLILMEK